MTCTEFRPPSRSIWFASIVKEFRFEAAHWLPGMPEDHKCHRLHGHSFMAEIHVEGPVDPATGMVCDFADIKALWRPLEEQLDHNCLNTVQGLENPTSENIAAWIYYKLRDGFARPIRLQKVVVHETCTCRAEYDGR